MPLEQIAQFAAVLSVAVSLAALAWSAVVYVRVKRDDLARAQYQKFFEVMEHLGKEGGSIASKMAAAYELRKFPEYTDVILRLSAKADYHGAAAKMLKDEVDLTSEFLRAKQR